MDKTILLASFIFPERKEWFINYLNTNFQVETDKIFGFKNINDESKIIVTFRLKIIWSKYIDLKNLFPNAIIIHKKGSTFYTINALNKLIESISSGNVGNIDHKSIKINWEEYANKLILVDNKELSICDIIRIF